MGTENLVPTGIRYPDRPACSESLYCVSYPVPQVKIRVIYFPRTFHPKKSKVDEPQFNNAEKSDCCLVRRSWAIIWEAKHEIQVITDVIRKTDPGSRAV